VEEITSLGGPVELRDGELVLAIPLAEGGAQLQAAARAISRVEGDELVVVIPGWLATKLRIAEGSPVIVDNRGGKLDITPELA
jgi:hypothetical protein